MASRDLACVEGAALRRGKAEHGWWPWWWRLPRAPSRLFLQMWDLEAILSEAGGEGRGSETAYFPRATIRG